MNITREPIDIEAIRRNFDLLDQEAILHHSKPAESSQPVRNVRQTLGPVLQNSFSDVADGFLPTPRVTSENTSAPPICTGSKEKCVRNVRTHRFEHVRSNQRFAEIAETIAAAGAVALDIETYGNGKRGGLNPWQGDIPLLSLALPGRVWLVDLQSTGYDLGALKPVLEQVEILGHNVKFDVLWLRLKCGLSVSQVYCTMTAARLLSAGLEPPPKHSLDALLLRFLDLDPSPDLSVSDWSNPILLEEQLDYAANDVAHLHLLKEKLQYQITETEMGGIAEAEMRLIPVVVEMEFNGIPVDNSRIDELLEKTTANLERAAEQLRLELGDAAINPRSPKAMLKALQRRGLDIPSTDEAVLTNFNTRPEVASLLHYRKADKLLQQLEKLKEASVDGGRVHCHFNPTGTDTGRFTASEPNMQNLARGDLRSCVAAPPGRRLIVADYAQIELRAAAVLAGEEAMIRAYTEGIDLHKKTASVVLGKAIDEINKEDRQLAKAVNFGLLFGQQAKGLKQYADSAYGVTINLTEAERYRTEFFKAYPVLEQWHSKSRTDAGNAKVTESRTRAGRRRLLVPASRNNWWKRFTTLVNAPVQGSCAEGLKHAMIRLHESLPTGALLVSTVHDELLVECDAEQANEVCNLLRDVMESEMHKLFPEIPIEVEASVCQTWAEKS